MQPLTFVTKQDAAALAIEAECRRQLIDIQVEKPLIVAVGGDGTMLQAVKEHHDKDVIFVGISAGSLGLLQTVNVHQIPQLAEALQKGSYHLLQAPLLSVAHCHPEGEDARQDEETQVIGYGFNDISLERQQSRAAKFRLKIDGSAGDFIGDGVIFSTPLGSTAYSLAAGGPIIDSRLQDVFVITPNNAHLSSLHSSLQRPHVLSRERVVRIEIAEDNRPLQIAIDGQLAAQDITSPLSIRLSDRHVQILQLTPDKYHTQIEEKRLGRL